MKRRDFLLDAACATGIAFSAVLAHCDSPAAGADEQQGKQRRAATGPLRVHPTNRRYFTDGSGKAVYLTGSHTWGSLQDGGVVDPPPAFDFTAYLDFLEKHKHNFIRLWRAEPTRSVWKDNPAHYYAPHPWLRTGPENALDGKPRFDLSRLDDAYFDRLRTRVAAAGERGIYVSIMLFEGWDLYYSSWDGHPFNVRNNVQGINGDPNGDGKGLEIQMLAVPAVTVVQEAYVRKVIDTVNDLDNVLYEISNESRLLGSKVSSQGWQYHFIQFIKQYESTKPRQHPVGMTSQGYGGGDDSEILFNSVADWISPNPDKYDFRKNPPASDGRKVILLDTDHLWGIGGDRTWVWKSFLRGYNPIWMDPFDRSRNGTTNTWGPVLPADADEVRRNLGYTLGYAKKMDLAAMTPLNDLASTAYCLASPGHEYLVYLPEGREVTVDLSATAKAFVVEWFDPRSGASRSGEAVTGGTRRSFHSPFDNDAVLYLAVTGGKDQQP